MSDREPPRDEAYYEALRKRAIPERLLIRLANTEIIDERNLTTTVSAARLSDGKLTRRHLEVLQLVSDGYTIPWIAENLEIRPETVHKYLRQIKAVLDVRTVPQAVKIALQKGVIG